MLQSLQAVVREARIAECSPAVKACCRQYPPSVRTPRIDVARKSWGKLNSPHSPEVATTLNHFLDGHRMPFRLSTPSVLTTTRLLLLHYITRQLSCIATIDPKAAAEGCKHGVDSGSAADLLPWGSQSRARPRALHHQRHWQDQCQCIFRHSLQIFKPFARGQRLLGLSARSRAVTERALAKSQQSGTASSHALRLVAQQFHTPAMAGDYSPRSRQENSNTAGLSLADPIFDPQPGFDFHEGHEATQKSGFHQDHRDDQQAFFHPVNPNHSR